eukprot:12291856-Heterocapsa_arctica.AAC.1
MTTNPYTLSPPPWNHIFPAEATPLRGAEKGHREKFRGSEGLLLTGPGAVVHRLWREWTGAIY